MNHHTNTFTGIVLHNQLLKESIFTGKQLLKKPKQLLKQLKYYLNDSLFLDSGRWVRVYIDPGSIISAS